MEAAIISGNTETAEACISELGMKLQEEITHLEAMRREINALTEQEDKTDTFKQSIESLTVLYKSKTESLSISLKRHKELETSLNLLKQQTNSIKSNKDSGQICVKLNEVKIIEGLAKSICSILRQIIAARNSRQSAAFGLTAIEFYSRVPLQQQSLTRNDRHVVKNVGRQFIEHTGCDLRNQHTERVVRNGLEVLTNQIGTHDNYDIKQEDKGSIFNPDKYKKQVTRRTRYEI